MNSMIGKHFTSEEKRIWWLENLLYSRENEFDDWKTFYVREKTNLMTGKTFYVRGKTNSMTEKPFT